MAWDRFPRIFLFSLLPLFSVLRQWTCDGDEDDDDHHDDDDPDDDEETTKSGEGTRVQIQSPLKDWTIARFLMDFSLRLSGGRRRARPGDLRAKFYDGLFLEAIWGPVQGPSRGPPGLTISMTRK